MVNILLEEGALTTGVSRPLRPGHDRGHHGALHPDVAGARAAAWTIPASSRGSRPTSHGSSPTERPRPAPSWPSLREAHELPEQRGRPDASASADASLARGCRDRGASRAGGEGDGGRRAAGTLVAACALWLRRARPRAAPVAPPARRPSPTPLTGKRERAPAASRCQLTSGTCPTTTRVSCWSSRAAPDAAVPAQAQPRLAVQVHQHAWRWTRPTPTTSAT